MTADASRQFYIILNKTAIYRKIVYDIDKKENLF